GNIVLRDRQHLSQDGLIIVVLTMDSNSGTVVSGPDVISRGFVYVRESENLMDDVKRVVRALELYETTGLTLSEQNENSKTEPSPYEPIMLALNTEREVLYERINLRVDIMLTSGLLDEIKTLKQMGFTKDMQSMQGIGYKEILSYLDGELGLDEAIELVKKNSRNYAKRQLTWFKRDERYKWLDCMADDLTYQAEKTVEEAIG
ncbi:MAG: hypothetical protein II978_04050, partial [Clostridia bacterium]|nr:hypothetical protein [Clostridia bacterium]